ncbi:unnamed protein product, partial [Schistosoma turkestanicum]
IIVTDENDNHPIFRNKSLIVSVPENSPKGLHLIQLIADDPDEGKSGQVVYSLVNSNNHNNNIDMTSTSSSKLSTTNHSGYRQSHNTIHNSSTLSISNTKSHADHTSNNSSDLENELFEIHPKTGWLIIRGSLDYEQSKHHLLRVLAHDQLGHSGFDEAIVSVYVTDINDIAPQITVESVNGISSNKLTDNHRNYKKNLLQIYVNETPGLNFIHSKFNNEHVNVYSRNEASLITMTQLLAFIVVNDPDTGPGGQFQCHLQSNNDNNNNNNNNKLFKSNMYTSSSSMKPMMNNLDKLYYYPTQYPINEQTNQYSSFIQSNRFTTGTSTTTTTTSIDQSSIVGVFQLNPISNMNFELITINGFDYEYSKTESVK